MSAHLPRRAAVAAAACLAVAGGALAIAGTSSGHGAPAADTAAGKASTTTTPTTKPPARHPFGGRGFGGFARPSFLGGSGTVATVTSAGFTVKAANGTATFTTSSSTVYEEVGVPVSRGALAVGERVLVRPGKPATSGSSTQVATDVEIVLPELSGKVLSVSGSQLVLQDSQGFWRTVDISSSTAYGQSGKSAAASAVKTGIYVLVAGDIASDHTTLDATAVSVLGPQPQQGGAGGAGFFGGAGGAFDPGGPAYFGGPPPAFHPQQPQGPASGSGTD